jgi:hypothetical protein
MKRIYFIFKSGLYQNTNQSPFCNVKISFTVVLNISDIFIANNVDGTYFSDSMEFIV